MGGGGDQKWGGCTAYAFDYAGEHGGGGSVAGFLGLGELVSGLIVDNDIAEK